MSNLNKETVLVLNRNWQAINALCPAEALSMMYAGTATGLDIVSYEHMVPYKWADWVQLPYDEKSNYISTVNGKVKIPKVLVLCHFDKVPMKRPKFTLKGIWIRDNGICQYTGQKLSTNQGNIDHIIPRSRGGKTDWTNCVLTHRLVNAKKGNKTPEEAGLKLIKQPTIPKQLPITYYIRNKHNVPEWNLFLT